MSCLNHRKHDDLRLRRRLSLLKATGLKTDETDWNGFFIPPAADKDEPKASQSPFKSVPSVSSVFQSCRSTPKALKREAHKKSSW